MFSKLISVRSERLFELFKIAAFSKAQILDQFKTKFGEVEIPESVAKDFHDLFGIWKDYGPSFLDRFQSVEDLKVFIEKCKSEVNFIQLKLSSFGLPQAAAQNMALQYLHKFVEEILSNSPDFHSRIEQLKDKKEFADILKGEKKKSELSPELEAEKGNLEGLGKDYINWIEKIIAASKTGGEVHSVSDIISLCEAFRASEGNFDKKIWELNSYSEAQKYLDNQSENSKAAYLESIRIPAQSEGMSKVVYEDENWKVVVIGSTIAGQWWGRNTDFCISGRENNFFARYALNQNIDPYFIIKKNAQSSDKMRMFTVAIERGYDEYVTFSKNGSTMTDANNHGITFEDVKQEVGLDWEKIESSIMEDAKSRKQSLARENLPKIKESIINLDESKIKKFMAEIIQSSNSGDHNLVDLLENVINNGAGDKVVVFYGKELSQSKPERFLGKSRWFEDKLSSEGFKDMLNVAAKNYAERYPGDFFYYYAKEPWATPYLGIAAKAYAEKNPGGFLYSYAKEPWATPYLGIAAKAYAEKKPGEFLYHADEPWAEPYIGIAAKAYAEKDSWEFLCKYAKEPWATPYLGIAVKDYAEKDPGNFLYSYAEEPWATPYIDGVAKACVEKIPRDFIFNFAKKPWAEPYLGIAAKAYAEKIPRDFLYYAKEPWATPYIDGAAKALAEKEPGEFLYHADKPWATPYIDGAIKTLMEKRPGFFLYHFFDKPWAAPYIDGAFKAYAEKEPWDFLSNYADKSFATPYLGMASKAYAEKEPGYFLSKFAEKPWAAPYLDGAAKAYAEKEPGYFLSKFAEKPWAAPYLDETAKVYAEMNPGEFIRYFFGEPWATPYIDEAKRRLDAQDINTDDSKEHLETLANALSHLGFKKEAKLIKDI